MYDERLAVPVVASLASGGDGLGVVPSYGEDWLTEGARQLSAAPLEQIMAQLRAARRRQIELATTFTAEHFNRPLTPAWHDRGGTTRKSPGWVLNKTVQHTWEHGNAILRIALFALR